MKKKKATKRATGAKTAPVVRASKRRGSGVAVDAKIDLWVPDKKPERQWKPKGSAGPVMPAIPDEARVGDVEVFGRTQRVVNIDKVTSSAQRELLEEFYSTNSNGVPVAEWYCPESECVGILLDGRVHHSWNCPWWDKPENKHKTPF